jgi:hypothetical protein
MIAHKQKYMKPGGAFDNGQRYWNHNTRKFPLEHFYCNCNTSSVTMTRGASYPTEFLGFTKNAANVLKVVQEKFPGNPSLLPLFSDDDRKVVLVSSPPPTPQEASLTGVGGIGKWLERKIHPRVRAAFEELGPPPFYVGRFPDVISNHAQYQLLQAWDHVMALQPVYGHGESKRSSSPALHLGVWQRYTKTPIITGDSRQIGAPCSTRKELVAALHDLCGIIKHLVMPKLRGIIEWYLPGHEWIWEA